MQNPIVALKLQTLIMEAVANISSWVWPALLLWMYAWVHDVTNQIKETIPYNLKVDGHQSYRPLYKSVSQQSAHHQSVSHHGIAFWLERQTHNRKVVSSNPGRRGGRIFISRFNFVCWLLLGVHSTPVLLQWYVKGHGHSAKSAGGRLHLNMHTPVTHRSQSGLTMPLSRESVGIYQKTSSHTTRQGPLSRSHLSSLSHCGLILA